MRVDFFNAIVQFLFLFYERLSQSADVVHFSFCVGETLFEFLLDVCGGSVREGVDGGSGGGG